MVALSPSRNQVSSAAVALGKWSTGAAALVVFGFLYWLLTSETGTMIVGGIIMAGVLLAAGLSLPAVLTYGLWRIGALIWRHWS